MKSIKLMMIAGMMAMPIAHSEETAAPAAAHGQGQGLEKRVDNQHQRIDHLQKNGKITTEEAAALNQKVDATGAKIVEAKKDGVTKEERRELRQELRASHREIKRARKSKK